MKIVYLSNYFNHHQKYLADELYKRLGNDYKFIETREVPEEKLKLGYHNFSEPYVLRYDQQSKEIIDHLIFDADVVICGESPVQLIKKRVRHGKFVIRDDERRYKNITKYLKWPIYTYNSYYYNKGVLFSASAFAPRDYLLSGMLSSRCFKWGYFPEVRQYENIDIVLETKRKNATLNKIDVSILWVARLISWKHPEAAIYVANSLKKDNVKFEMNIIGIGPLKEAIQKQIVVNGLTNCVHMLGSMPPENVRNYMEMSDVFLFTSDQNEGWGATLNESMNSACAVVAGHLIGSVPYLLKDGENGLIFRNKDWTKLYEKVKWLVDNPHERQKMGKNAYHTLITKWNPVNAANSLISFLDAFLQGKDTPIIDGPCSRAEIITHDWYK